MDHERGKDPTPQGRVPANPEPRQVRGGGDLGPEGYEHSEPGPAVRKDGVFFFGKKERRDSPKS